MTTNGEMPMKLGISAPRLGWLSLIILLTPY
jgi:hypothetical protein